MPVPGIGQLDPQPGDVGLRLRGLRGHAGTGQQGQLNRDADFSVVPLERAEIVFVVVELGEEAVLSHQVDAREAGSAGAAQLELFRGDLRFESPQFHVGR